ncbi:unnamed protein product [Peniophora sp. CBMAI 1063]|nr:unnamed protein product [Peniophora sp. CBMAI 1063]
METRARVDAEVPRGRDARRQSDGVGSLPEKKDVLCLDLGVLAMQGGVLLSFVQLPGRAPHVLKAILSSCIDKLAISEQKIKLDLPMTFLRANRVSTTLLHSSLDAHKDQNNDASRWCDVVSNLWRVPMKLGATTGNASWAWLTLRMLVRTSLLGGGAIYEEGREWVRRQFVLSVGSGTA